MQRKGGKLYGSRKSCPNAFIMLEFCGILGITVNELLGGERIIDMEEYQNKVEENMIEIKMQLKSYKKRIIINNIYLLVATVSALTVPWAMVFIVFVIAFRNYYLFKNLKSVKRIIENNHNVLKAVKGEKK